MAVGKGWGRRKRGIILQYHRVFVKVIAYKILLFGYVVNHAHVCLVGLNTVNIGYS